MVSSFEFADHVVGILIKADMDEDLFSRIQDMVEDKITEYGKINLFLEIEKGYNISLKAMLKHLKFSVEYSENFNKVAVVSGRPIVKSAVMIKDLLIGAEVKSFTHDERLEAIQWIAE